MADIKNNKDGSKTVTVTVSENFDDGLLASLVRQLERGAGAQFVVGNLADLQRAGAIAVAAGSGEELGKGGDSFAKGVLLNPNTDPDDAKAGAERTIAEEKEAKAEPEAEDPPKSDEPLTPKDPTSQSPEPATR